LAFHADQLTLSGPRAGDRRDALFRERVPAMLRRWALGAAWALMPGRIAGLPGLARLCLTELMAPDHALPDPESALARPPGLAGIVHDLSVPTLLSAYRRGLYPFAHIAPLKWWSPPQRSVLFFDEFHIAKSLRRELRRSRYTVTFDRDFEGVITACAGRRKGRWHLTWITPRIMRAYADLFDAGHVHSFEVYNEAGQLAGGGYGVAIGGAFFIESLFSAEYNTSKIGLTVLNWHLAKWGYAFNDGKLMAPTWKNMGEREIPRHEFLARLAKAVRAPGKSGRWQVEADLAAVSHWQPAKPASAG
jgi:leucyl/phenylalanyl-tRNA---protein transferase